jgi:hypothetical protein
VAISNFCATLVLKSVLALLQRPRRARDVAAAVPGHQLAPARAAVLVADVQTKRLKLEQRGCALISRNHAVLKTFTFARLLRDAWLAWPARIGPELAAQSGSTPARSPWRSNAVRVLLAELLQGGSSLTGESRSSYPTRGADGPPPP